MFGFVINPRLATRPRSPKKPDTAEPGSGLAWGAELLAKEIGFHHGVRESVLAMDDYASCLS